MPSRGLDGGSLNIILSWRTPYPRKVENAVDLGTRLPGVPTLFVWVSQRESSTIESTFEFRSIP